MDLANKYDIFSLTIYERPNLHIRLMVEVKSSVAVVVGVFCFHELQEVKLFLRQKVWCYLH